MVFLFQKTLDGRQQIYNRWDLQEKVKGTIEFLTKECSCKCGCRTLVCGCHKKSQHCGQGCECHGCTNLAVHATYESSYDDQSDASLTEMAAPLRSVTIWTSKL